MHEIKRFFAAAVLIVFVAVSYSQAAVTTKSSERRWYEKYAWIKSYFIVENGAAPAISENVVPDKNFKLIALRVGSDGAIGTSENLTISITRSAAAGLNGVIFRKDLSTVSLPYEYAFDPMRHYEEGDAITIAFSNTDANAITIELITQQSDEN